jgi:hypothetical protein
MPCSKDLAQRPRRRWEPFVRALRLKLILQCPRNKMRRGSQRIVNHAPHRMQQELLRRIRADDVHAYRSGQHASCMEEQVQVRATLYMHTHISRRSELRVRVLTDCQAQCASQNAPTDREMPSGRIGLPAPHA